MIEIITAIVTHTVIFKGFGYCINNW